MKCPKCRTTMTRVKKSEHEYEHVCPKCGAKLK